MTCYIITVDGDEPPEPPAPPGATHVFIIDIWKAFPWSKSGAEAVAAIADYLAGLEVFGYKLDMSGITGWDPLKVEYFDEKSQIYIWFEKTGSPHIPAIMLGVVLILLALGIIIYVWTFKTISGDIIEIVDEYLRADCIKKRLEEGYTPEEALALCPQEEEGGWESKLIPIAAIIGGAWILSEFVKSR